MKRNQAIRTLSVSLLSSTLVGMLGGCAPMAASMSNTGVTKTDVVPTPPTKPDLLGCITDAADYELAGSVDSFAMDGGFGFNIGASPGGFLKLIGLDVGYSKGTMTTAMHLFRPLRNPSAIANATGDATRNSIKFGIDFGINIIGGGLSFWSTTRPAEMASAALQKNITNLLTTLGDNEPEWETHISYMVSDTEFQIPVGYKSGIMKGDEFEIYPVAFDWADPNKPCGSQLNFERPLSDKPIAKAYVKYKPEADVADLVVVGEVSGKLEKYNKVVISKLADGADQQPRTSLGRIIHIRSMTSLPLKFADPNGGNAVQTIDISPFVKNQLEEILALPNFGGFAVR